MKSFPVVPRRVLVLKDEHGRLLATQEVDKRNELNSRVVSSNVNASAHRRPECRSRLSAATWVRRGST